MCGKDYTAVGEGRQKRGSPPHVRERPAAQPVEYDVPGITPACAGKTLLDSSPNRRRWDHPRMCGKDRRIVILAGI